MDNPTKVVNRGVGPNGTQPLGQKPASAESDVLKPKVQSAHSTPGASALSPEGRSQRIAQVNSDIAGRKPPAPPAPIPGLSHSGATPTPKAAMPKNPAKSFSIMDRLKTAGSSFMNTVGKMGKQVQQKVQGAAQMPGINNKMLKNTQESNDLEKGQMSKLGKPGLTEKLQGEARERASAAGQPVVQPPHASNLAPSKPVAPPVAAKPLAPHVAEAHKSVKSRANHNKIAQNVKRVKAPAEKPNPLPNPQPQDHAVKSPENHQHFAQQATQPTLTPPRSKNIIPKTDPRNVKAVLAAQQRQKDTEKTAPVPTAETKDGWSRPHDETTGEITQEMKPVSQKVEVKKPNDPHDSEKTEQLIENAKLVGGKHPTQKDTNMDGEATAPLEAPQKGQLPVKDLGVKKPFQGQDSHSKLLSFLHQLVAPGTQSHDPNAMVQHSKHFLQKSEPAPLVSVGNRKKILHHMRKCAKMPS